MGKTKVSPKSAAKTRSRSTSKIEKEASIAATLAEIDQLKPKTKKAAKVLALLKTWLTDESGYDEQAWPKLKLAIESQHKRVGAWKLFDD